jgi:RNA polymerase sigma factor (sigma-70 family)
MTLTEFEALYTKYQRLFLATARKELAKTRSITEEPEDVTQAALLEILEGSQHETFKSEGAAVAFVKTRIISRVIDLRRHVLGHKAPAYSALRAFGFGSSDEKHDRKLALRDAFERALARFKNPQAQDFLALVYIQGYTVGEAAGLTGLSTANGWKTMERLREYLKEEDSPLI